MRRIALPLLFALLGCASINRSYVSQLAVRASFDMNCPAQSLVFTELAKSGWIVTTYGVRGCGQQLTYVWVEASRAWVLNSETR